MTNLDSILAELRTFVSERDWEQFHDPKNLAMLLASEAGELLAEYRWIANGDADRWSKDPENLARIQAEIGDVGIALLMLCDRVGIDVTEAIPVLGIPKGRLDLQRFIHWNIMKCFWNDDFDFHTNNIINFDWYHPEYCFRFEPDEFRSWFDEGWDIQAFNVQDAGISCRAKRA